MKRLLVIIVVIGVAGFIGYRVWDAYQAKQVADGKGAKGKGAGKKGAQVVSVGVAQVRQGQVREEIAITGSLRPKEQVDVTAKVTGRVELIRLNVGDRVKVGDLVAVLEDSEIPAAGAAGDGITGSGAGDFGTAAGGDGERAGGSGAVAAVDGRGIDPAAGV